jgi:fatty acid desaturase
LVLGGVWIWLVGCLAILGISILDEALGVQGEQTEHGARWLYDMQLYAALPLLIMVTLLFLHYLGQSDPLGLVHGLSLLGVTFGGARETIHWPTVCAVTFVTGFFYGAVGMTVAHELLHRTDSTTAQRVARVLLALNNNGHYATSHLYGHHRNVATFDDPTTARRGEAAFFFVPRCIWGELREALRIEKARLRKKGLTHLSWRNRILQDQLYGVAVVVTVIAVAGYRGLIGFTIAASLGTSIQRLIDYVQHYGLVRVPGAPIEAHHSWECDHFLSRLAQYNLALHPDHHLAAGKPYWELRPRPDAPCLPCGFTSAVLLSLIPPLWRRMIDPLLADWDQQLANEAERKLVRELYPASAFATASS